MSDSPRANAVVDISPARRQAARTRASSAPPIQLLSPPPVVGDAQFTIDGRVLKQRGYDRGLEAPILLPDAPGRRV
ncbi:hypothetical protein [Kribbella sp. DT2]|uniref:hypothetical protein n=1 Tax=Kribbella sp. DT2 TaxID=3393427 RepID=UPI003CE6E987